jgi:geranylgeranyl diphosphate synthase type II
MRKNYINQFFKQMHSLAEITALYEKNFDKKNFDLQPKSLYQAVNHILAIKGKRIRPLLLLMACDLFEGNLSIALNPAFALEVFHNFSLVHDDIMDAADIRRGQPTVHKLYGVNNAILAGDAMQVHVYKLLLSAPAPFLSDLLNVFTKAAIEVVEGQQMDMDFETRTDVTIPEYLQMIGYKTSVLLAAALQMGAILGNASLADQEHIYQFGLNLGLSFQIKDDWLDTFGEAEKVGKKIGGDILQNKKTFLLITAFNMATETEKAELQALLAHKNDTEKIAGVQALFAKLKISEIASKKIEELYQLSLSSLDAISLNSEKKEPLRTLAAMIHNRQF